MENSLSPQKYERLSFQEMKQEVLGHFYFERGIAFTFFMMLKNPERLISIYLNEDRKKVFNPFRFVLIGVAVSTLIVINHSGFKAFLASLHTQNSETFTTLGTELNLPLWEIFLYTQELFLSYQNVLIIVSLPFISWVTWKFFRNKRYNYAEHLVINGFVFGTTYWFSSIVALLTSFAEAKSVATYMISLITFVLATYLYKRIFRSGIIRSFLGILLVYIPIYIIGIFFQIIVFIALLSFS